MPPVRFPPSPARSRSACRAALTGQTVAPSAFDAFVPSGRGPAIPRLAVE